MNRPTSSTDTTARDGSPSKDWAAALNRRLVAVLDRHGVSTEIVDSCTVRFRAVPLAAGFSKRRSNLLLRRSGLDCGCSVYVDSDLQYEGADQTLTAALAGPDQRNWRRLRLPAVDGPINEALCSVLRILGSPLASPTAQALRPQPGQRPPQATEEPLPGRILAATAEPITPQMASAAFESSFRKPLARQLAVVTTRVAAPRAAVLWGPSGAGRDYLLVAAAWPLFDAGIVARAYRIWGAKLAAGCLVPQELDASLMGLLGEVAPLDACLVLVQDIDLCLTGSTVSHTLLCEALDRGLRLLGTVRKPAFVRRMRADEALGRRLVPVRVAAPRRAETIEALEHLASQSNVEVVAPAIQTALRIAEGQTSGQPATAIGLLSAALAEATWQRRDSVGPDDVFAALDSLWPEGLGDPDDRDA